MSDHTTSRAKETAASIRRELKLTGIKPRSVTSKPGEINNTVIVEITDADPKTFRTVDEICNKHRMLIPNPDNPHLLIANRDESFPKVSSVKLSNHLSDHMGRRIREYIHNHTPEFPTARSTADTSMQPTGSVRRYSGASVAGTKRTPTSTRPKISGAWV